MIRGEREEGSPADGLLALWLGGMSLPLAGFGLVVAARSRRQRRPRRWLVAAFLLAAVLTQVGCAEFTLLGPRPGTPTGTFEFTVTGSSNSIQRSATATLVVQ